MNYRAPSISALTITVEVLQARDLIAKDRSLLGQRTTSDPYVKVKLRTVSDHRTTQQIHCSELGQTAVLSKTLNPVWSGEKFQYTFGGSDAIQFLRCPSTSIHDVVLTLWDEDVVSEDDAMGTIYIPIASETSNIGPKWYAIGKGHGEAHCRNAKGELLVAISYEVRQLQDINRGQVCYLRQNRIRVGLAWDVERGQKVDLDCSCIAVDLNGQVLMDETVYYGNMANSNLSLQHTGDELTGEAIGDDEKILVELDLMPSNVLALYFLLTVSTSGKTFSDVRSARVHFYSTETHCGICRYVPHVMGDDNTALFLCRIAREKNSWILTPIEEGDAYARDFGSLVPEIKSYTRDLVPSIDVDPKERVAVLRKGGTMKISDYLPDSLVPDKVSLGLAWDVTNGTNVDLDASCILLDDRYNVVDIVSFRNLVSKDGWVRHSGDEREGDESGDDEIINFFLPNIDQRVKFMGIVINSYSGQELDDVARAKCHLFNPEDKSDIATYNLQHSKELDKKTALIMGCLYRGDRGSSGGWFGRGKDDNDHETWYFRIISLPAIGRTAQENVNDLKMYLSSTPPAPPILHDGIFVPPAMPENTVPVEEEIIVMPDTDIKVFIENMRDADRNLAQAFSG